MLYATVALVLPSPVVAMTNLVPVDYGFEFNGKHSDFAQQFYVRYVAKDDVPQLTRVTMRALPDALQKELASYSLTWDELPGLLQRALLWDAGYALTTDMAIVKIYTRTGRSMAEIFVPRKAYERTGCTPRPCSLPNGEVFYRHKFCDGDQMARASLCAVDGARQKPHAGMWGDGGEVDTIPEVRVLRHEWTEHSDTYLMYALHTVADEVVYNACPKTPAMIIPCAPYASVNQSEWSAPVRGRVVEAWLKKYSEDHQENRTWLLVPLTIVVFTLVGVITVYRYRAAVRDHVPETEALSGDHRDADFDSGSVEAFLLDSRTASDGRRDKTGSDDDDDDDDHPEGDLNAAAFEYFDASIGLSASAFDPMLVSFNRVHPLRSLQRIRASKRNAVAIRSFRLFESHRKIRAKRVLFRDIQFETQLAHGASGEVWRAMYKSEPVAVKQLLPSKRRELREMEMFMAEIYLMAQLSHPHIVALVGIAWNTLEHIVMVQELMVRGDLQRLLAEQREKPDDVGFTWTTQRRAIAVSIARALAYMHALQPKLLHRDVKSRNVLLAADMTAKLCDFGISRRKHASDDDAANLTATAAAGTMSWTPPELLVGEDYSEKVDIYAFGVLLTELDTCALPYHDAHSLELRLVQFPLRLMKLILNEGYRPKVSATCPPAIAHLIAQCLERDQEKRPTAQAICAMLAATDESVEALA